MTPDQIACASRPSNCWDYSCEVCWRVDPVDGWVYFVKADRLIKIGCTLSLRQRVRGLRGELLYAIRGYTRVEREMHHRFAHLREHGEWFAPGPDLVAFIASLAQPESAKVRAVAPELLGPDSGSASDSALEHAA